MQVDHRFAAGGLMQSVDVLGQQDLAFAHRLEPRQRAMRVVRPGAADAPPADQAARPIAPARRLLAHEGLEGDRRRALPGAVGVAIVGNARVHAAAGAGQDEQPPMPIDEFLKGGGRRHATKVVARSGSRHRRRRWPSGRHPLVNFAARLGAAMFANVLIANRGEIACRVVRTARRLGMRTIALATPADRGALHTRLADEAHEIGAGAEGYLDGEAIVALAQRVGAACVHPGYGFLSENADFAELCGEAGLVFVGPSPAAMRALGLKHAAKALMAKLGVPVAPGYYGDNQSPKFLKEKAYEIGYPVLIKAVAGGGGRGMRRVDAHVEFEAALEAAAREAVGAFGDPRVLIEKYRRRGASHRGAGVRRPPRRRRPPVRARLLAAAPASESGRGESRPRPA